MLRLRATFVLAALLAPPVVRAQPDPALWRFVSPNAKAVIGIDWARVRQSQAGAMIREKLIPHGVALGFPGVELLDQMDRILISSPGRDSANDEAEPPILIAIRGHFEGAHVRQFFNRSGSKPQSYNSFQVYRPRGKQSKDMAWVLFDAETILFGDAPSVFAALDRNQFPPAGSSSASAAGSMAARAAAMDASYEFWAIMDAAELLSNDRIAGFLEGSEWASEAQGVEAGISLRAGLIADVTVRFSSDTLAKRVTTELSRAVNLAAKDKGVNAHAQDIAKHLKFTADGSATRISLRLTEPELEKTAQAFAESEKAGREAALRANHAPTAAPAAISSKPGVIRIEGLDEGPREIPYPEPAH